MWVLLAILSAFSDSLKQLYAKHLTHTKDPLLMAFIGSLVITILLLPIVAFNGLPSIDINTFLISLLVVGSVNALTSFLVYKALTQTDISLISPLYTFTPLFVLITTPLFSDVTLSLFSISGILILLAGLYVVQCERGMSFTKIEYGQWVVLFVMFLWSISSHMYKIGMESSSALLFIASVHITIAISLLPFVFIYKKIQLVKTQWRAIVPLGILSAATSLLQWTAVSLTATVYVLTIKRMSSIFSVIGGIFLFKEKQGMQRILGSLIMIVGFFLLYLGIS